MAGLTHGGTRLNIGTHLIPVGYTLPVVTEFTDDEYISKEFIIDVPKSGVENASADTTLDNILVAVNAVIIAEVTENYDIVANDVDSFAVMNKLGNNFRHGQDFFTDVAIKYVAHVDIFVKAA